MKVDKALLVLAEEILNEMIEAESTDTGDYELFVKHFDRSELCLHLRATQEM